MRSVRWKNIKGAIIGAAVVCVISCLEMTRVIAEEDNDRLQAYQACKEYIISQGQTRDDDYFKGYVCEYPIDPNYVDEATTPITYFGVSEDSNNLSIISEFSDIDPAFKDFRYKIVLDGETGNYEITLPVTFFDTPVLYMITGSFDIETYSNEVVLTATDVTAEDDGVPSPLKQQLLPYPTSIIPSSIEMLNWWLNNSELDITMKDLGFDTFVSEAETLNSTIASADENTSEEIKGTYEYDTLGNGTDNSNNTPKFGPSNNDQTNNVGPQTMGGKPIKNNNDTGSQSSGAFTNKYGTPTTKCAHSGCNNYIASSGDTNCCAVHSNNCLECGKYIDEDAMYCMDCLNKAAKQTSSNTNSKNSSNIGEGGYEMPNEEDESFSDYVKRVDPELYDELFN